MGKEQIANRVLQIVVGLVLLGLLFLLHLHGFIHRVGWVGLIGLIPLWVGISGLYSDFKSSGSKAQPTAVASSKPETK
jgi:cadmium resistance protein CadD (predicted permease)